MLRNDMADALAAWQGAPVEEARRDELMARLRADDGFRREFAEALWMLSMVRVVQASEPRWLGLAEELGLCGDESDAGSDDAEKAIMAEVWRKPHRPISRGWRAMAMMSAGLAALLMLFLFIGKDKDAGLAGEERLPDERRLAVLSGTGGAVWEKEPFLAGGNWLRPGAHRLLAGRETLVFSDGVRVRLEAPLDFSLVDGATLSCHRGGMRVRVPDGAEGFRVQVPFGTVTDQGTEFAVLVGPDAATKVAVFEGKVELGIRQREHDGIRSMPMTRGEAIQVETDGTIRPSDATDMPPPPDLALPPMVLPDAYVSRILAARPRHYWRMDRMENGAIPDETGNGNPLVPVGTVEISADAGGRSSLRLSGGGGLQSLVPWRLRRDGAALELWFASEGSQRTCLAGLATGESNGQHLAILGHNDNAAEASPRMMLSNTLRFLTRWPAGARGGVNLFSEPVHSAFSWHHVVIQLKDRRMELHADGMPVRIATADPIPDSINAFLSLGFAHITSEDGKSIQADRFLIGRMAEVAVYDRVLTPGEIRERAGK